MTNPQAILIGAGVIALAVLGSRLIAPYQIVSGTAVVWRVNALTGKVELCNHTITIGSEVTGNPACR